MLTRGLKVANRQEMPSDIFQIMTAKIYRQLEKLNGLPNGKRLGTQNCKCWGDYKALTLSLTGEREHAAVE